MKKETAQRASDLLGVICRYELEIERYDKNADGCLGQPIKQYHLYVEETDLLRQAAIAHLKARKKSLEKELENLK